MGLALGAGAQVCGEGGLRLLAHLDQQARGVWPPVAGSSLFPRRRHHGRGQFVLERAAQPLQLRHLDGVVVAPEPIHQGAGWRHAGEQDVARLIGPHERQVPDVRQARGIVRKVIGVDPQVPDGRRGLTASGGESAAERLDFRRLDHAAAERGV